MFNPGGNVIAIPFGKGVFFTINDEALMRTLADNFDAIL
jgi:hypothetical protein